VKLVVEENESAALQAHIDASECVLATSRVALVEVVRAVRLANPAPEVERDAIRQVNACLLINVTDALLRHAARLASARLRTLDAVHVATASYVEPDEVLVYDKRLAEALSDEGLRIVSPV
jgi:predicted nucleic acid-binding protein